MCWFVEFFFTLFLLLSGVAGGLDETPNSAPEQRVAYTRQGALSDAGLYVSSLNRKQLKKIAEFGMMSKWSPDGMQLAYSGFRGDGGYGMNPTLDLYVYDFRTSKADKLTNCQNGESIRVSTWSPDGKRIAYAVAKKGETKLVILDLVSRQANAIVPSKSLTCAGDPSWAPDGKSLAVRACGTGQRGLALIDTSGNLIKMLPDPGEQSSDALPAWSPDGKHIAFASTRGGAERSKRSRRWSIFVMNADGTELHLLISHKELNVMWPSWSSDGTMLAYELSKRLSSSASGPELLATKVVVMRLSDGKVLTTFQDGTLQPALAPMTH